MGSKLTLVQPPLEVSRDFIDYPYLCDLGVVQAAAILREAGHQPNVIDALAQQESDLAETRTGYVALGTPLDVFTMGVKEAVLGTHVVVVAMTPFNRPPKRDPYLAASIEAIKEAAPDLPIVLADLYQSGQHYIHVDPQAILDAYPEVSVWLQYEAEADLVAVCESLIEQPRAPAQVVLGTAPLELDRLAFPAWDLVDLDAKANFLSKVVSKLGRSEWEFPLVGRTLPMLTSRGCPYTCTHCSSNPDVKPGAKKTQRRYSAAYLRRYLGHLKAAYGVDRVFILDEMLNVNQSHFDDVLGILSELEVRFEIPNGVRADHLYPKHLTILSEHISTLSVSAEHGSQEKLDHMVGKKLDLGHIERVARQAKEVGLPTMVHFIIGNPGESKHDIHATLDFAFHLFEHYDILPSVQYATPLPGTELEREVSAKQHLPVIQDFSPVFQKQPVTEGLDFKPADLKDLKWTFERRLQASNLQPVVLNLTKRCNNACMFCRVRDPNVADGMLEDLAATLAQKREQGATSVDLGGAEPTLHPDLVKLIRYSRKIGYTEVSLTTNGRMCAYESYAKILVNSGVTSLFISLHGADEATHGHLVGDSDAFSQTVEGIKHCIAHKPDSLELGINVTLTNTNVEVMSEHFEFIFKLGIERINLLFLKPFGEQTFELEPEVHHTVENVAALMEAWEGRVDCRVFNLPPNLMPSLNKKSRALQAEERG